MKSDVNDFEILASGQRLRARWFAPRRSPSQPVILILHQGLGSVSQWRAFPEALARTTGCAVVGYDRLGHGGSEPIRSDRQPDFLTKEACEVLPEVLQVLGLERPIVYGHSDGGTIALMFAAAFPDRPRAVISEAAHVFSEVHATGGIAALQVDYQSGELRGKLERHHGDNADSMFQSWAKIWLSPEMQDWSIIDQLARIRCPLMIIQGEADDHGTMAQVDTLVSRVTGARDVMIVPGVGHMPHIEATELVAAGVAEFIAKTLHAEAPT
jgi:pimeloyl-ACP methyl ester carboxylesterase